MRTYGKKMNGQLQRWPLYSQENIPRSPLDRSLDGPQSLCKHGGEEITATTGYRTPIIRPVT